ncbi:MAG: ferritin-like protein [Myxococcales bacterium]|nr:ferritin-like protein [Myxococcales bacterium]MCB9547988.1 ferritin-like protein [Myxococcales bacterium]
MIHLKSSLIAGLQAKTPSADAVIAALRQAVKLEHATIPVYLYALYSLDEQKNAAIAAILQSVVVEEMLHMTLASNVLAALDGPSPVGDPAFVPTYPGPLPGGVEAQLTVSLAPCSPAQLAAFLIIEQPEDPLHFKSVPLTEPDTITIGEFYAAISRALGELPASAFDPSGKRQVGPDLMDGAVVVTDCASAQAALQIIVEQGEGTATSPEEVDGTRLAHYYRFLQIQKGRALVPDAAGGWAYAGPPIVFDPTGVAGVPRDPDQPPYPPGSAEAFANDTFNYTYTSLLFALRDLFSGQNTSAQLNRSIGLMMSLKGQAKAMMAGIPNPAVLTGPSFEYRPTPAA